MHDILEFKKATVIQQRLAADQFEYHVQDPGRYHRLVHPGWYRIEAILNKDHYYSKDELEEIITYLCREISADVEWVKVIPALEQEYG